MNNNQIDVLISMKLANMRKLKILTIPCIWWILRTTILSEIFYMFWSCSTDWVSDLNFDQLHNQIIVISLFCKLLKGSISVILYIFIEYNEIELCKLFINQWLCIIDTLTSHKLEDNSICVTFFSYKLSIVNYK